MASNPILAIDEDIDDQITEFCRGRDGIAEADVIRDIARIVCIVNLVQNGTLDGEQMVLCGGMAMRCLDSPRMSIFDGDTASRLPPDPSALPSAISHDEEDMEIVAGPSQRGNQLITFRPVTYDARFSALAGAQDEFSLSVAHRGLEEDAIWRSLNHRYPFRLLADDVRVPVMHPDEILAEKVVAWWLFGHAKHYNDIAFLGGRLMADGRSDLERETRERVRGLVETKLGVNRRISGVQSRRIDALTEPIRRGRLLDPDEHLDNRHDFETLSYLHAERPRRAEIDRIVQRVVIPVLLDE